MKVGYALVFVLPFLGLGCKQQPQSVQSQTPPQGMVISDGSNTWFLGGAKMNGTTGVATVTGIVSKDGTNAIPATAVITETRKAGGSKP